jgi:hypothetical protein
MSALPTAQADMLDRLKRADDLRKDHGAAGVVHVAAPARIEALLAVGRQGLATTWWGDGKDAGLLLGRITTAGRVHP